MKYREIYKALERRWQVSPGFCFSDFSGWRNPRSAYNSHRPPLWIVVVDRVSMQRIWITHECGILEVNYTNINEQGHRCGELYRSRFNSQTEAVKALERVFVRQTKAA